MASDSGFYETVPHRKLAVECFNAAWTLIEKAKRTPQDDLRMIHLAHTSRYHWEIVGTALNVARGEWQISRVYSVLGRAEPAMYHAERCLEVTIENGIGDFDLAFAYEAMARALAVAGHAEQSREYIERAREVGAGITEEDDREHFFRELESIG